MTGCVEAVPTTRLFQSGIQNAASLRGFQPRRTAGPTYGNGMQVAGLLATIESAGHLTKLSFSEERHRDGSHTSVVTLFLLRRTKPLTCEAILAKSMD